jgi:hypothetical protein
MFNIRHIGKISMGTYIIHVVKQKLQGFKEQKSPMLSTTQEVVVLGTKVLA